MCLLEVSWLVAAGERSCLPIALRACKLGGDPPCDGITRTSPGPEGSKDTVALSGARGITYT